MGNLAEETGRGHRSRRVDGFRWLPFLDAVIVARQALVHCDERTRRQLQRIFDAERGLFHSSEVAI